MSNVDKIAEKISRDYENLKHKYWTLKQFYKVCTAERHKLMERQKEAARILKVAKDLCQYHRTMPYPLADAERLYIMIKQYDNDSE